MKTKVYFLLTVLFALGGIEMHAQEDKNTRSIVIEFDREALSWPIGETQVSLRELTFHDKALRGALEKNEIGRLKRAFTQFQPADTIGVSRTGERIKLPDLSNIYVVNIPARKDVDQVIKEFSQLQGVVFAEPMGSSSTLGTTLPNDQHFSDQWGLHNTGQGGGTPDADIDAPEAWSITTGSSSTKIAILDTGVDGSHPDLSGKVSGDSGWSEPHGTFVAGIAAAKTNNGQGIAGVDWNAQIISQRIDIGGQPGQYSAVMDAVNSGADILNNSWILIDRYGQPAYSVLIRRAFANAYKMNVIATAGMGNDNNSTVNYPVGFGKGIIAVGATDNKDMRWVQTAPPAGSNTGYHIDVVAPGGSMISTIPSSGYGQDAGTSIATPHVSGIAGLMLAVKPNLYNDDVEQIIRLSADDLGNAGWDTSFGTGRVNAKKALDFLQAPYVLKQWSATGGTVYSTTSYYGTFYDLPGGAPNGNYIGTRYEVRKTIMFPESFSSIVGVWNRGVATTGYSADVPNYTMGHADVISSNSTSITLRTYVYNISRLDGSYAGWYPTTPSNVTFAYSVLGIPGGSGPPAPPSNLVITNNGQANQNPNLSWTASPTSGVTYKVERCNTGNPAGSLPCTWQTIASGISSTTYTDFGVIMMTSGNPSGSDWRYQVRAQKAGQQSSPSNIVSTWGSSPMKRPPLDEEQVGIPKEFGLDQNYPNPFNPSTLMRFALPEAANVMIKIVDMLGREVKTFHRPDLFAGYHQLTWDGTNTAGVPVTSGVYLYRIEALGESGQNFTKTLKMILMK